MNSRVKRFGLLYFFISYRLLSILAQNPNDAISISQINEKFLEHLIKIKVDEVREQRQLKSLYNDSILYVAAKFHANYLFKKEKLSHDEPEDKKMETPQKRAEFFGAVNYLVGENVAYTTIQLPLKDKKGKTYTNTSYDETAQDLVTAWVNSPGHYKNIITTDYNATGVAIWIDLKSKRIYAVQKFANILYKYNFFENKSCFSYSNFVPPQTANSFDGIPNRAHKGKHAFRLKAIKDSSKCKSCFVADTNFRFGQTHIEYENKTIYLVSYDPQPILDLLKKRKDGFAAELISYDPFDCGNPEYYTQPSRRNGQCIFSGKILKPVYRKEAFKGFRLGDANQKKIQARISYGKLKKYKLKLGKLPKHLTSYTEVNLAVIQKRRVCKIFHFSSVCGDTLDKFYNLPFYHDTISNHSDVESDYKSFTFNIPFQKNKTAFSMKDIKPIMDSALSERFIADTIEINAFSSVEGSEKTNRFLQMQRARNLADVICSNQKKKVHRVIKADENWDLFNEQIKKDKVLDVFKDKTKEQVKKDLEDTLLQKKLEKYLSPQRMAMVRVYAKEPISDKNVESYLTTKVNLLSKHIQKLDKKYKADSLRVLLDSLTFFMEVAYNKVKNGIIKPVFFKRFEIGESKDYNNFHTQRLKYKIQLIGIEQNNISWVKEIYEELVNLYNKDARSFFINYNMLNLIQQYGKEINVKIANAQKNGYANELKSYAESEHEKELANKIALNFWFDIARLPLAELPEAEQSECVNALLGIHTYFKTQSLSTNELNKLSAFYLYHSMANWVVESLWPDFEAKKNNPEGLKILAKTLYQNYEETKSTKYSEFLVQVYDIIGKEAWCPMFVGPCNISFQVLDYENFRNYYCERCSDYLNYAKRPQSQKE